MVLEDVLACSPVSQLQDRYNSAADTADESLGTEVKRSPMVTEKKDPRNSTRHQQRTGRAYPLPGQDGNGIS